MKRLGGCLLQVLATVVGLFMLLVFGVMTYGALNAVHGLFVALGEMLGI